MATIKLLGISGALREGSTNRMLLKEAARLAGDVDYSEADLQLPLYDGDDEAKSGVPARVEALAKQVSEADAVVISTPEYNGAISGVLKNALDWVSRVEDNPWASKPVALMSAAAGRGGGNQAQVMLLSCMTNFAPRIVSGPLVAVAGSFEAFDDAGQLKGEMYVNNLTALMEKLRAAV
ncbi:NAD(P)H-dependent oxidoreductase [Lentibacter algarum]|uniref:NADPH-dependent FMN reductase n=1 Tax=Lentibacter algarum TaxID=576131 RepID=UPI001C078CDA|nr:NAD(P)H-dependent oxidoreductase [Lentibacter algarum]MBU2980404.1 NAD(P)H-dependent oxidoreductase [Lentibacter algarum]